MLIIFSKIKRILWPTNMLNMSGERGFLLSLSLVYIIYIKELQIFFFS